MYFVGLCRCRNTGDRQYVRQDITYILGRIQEDLLKGFLVIPLRDADGVFSAPIVNSSGNVELEFGCDRGYLTDNGCSKYANLDNAFNVYLISS